MTPEDVAKMALTLRPLDEDGLIIKPDLEELLFDAQDCVERFKAGQTEAIEAAIEGGHLLALARDLTGQGDWIAWLAKVGLNRMTANRWMRLEALGMAAAEVVEKGGMSAVLREASDRQRPSKPASQRLAEVTARIAGLKDDYYSALSERQRLLREVKASGEENVT